MSVVADDLKRAAATAALAFVRPGMVVGVGTGSTTNHFIDGLGAMRDQVAGAVASSRASAERLAARGIRVIDANDAATLPLYIDGADECNPRLELIKGGGGALSGEKIVAAASETFVCIIDASKLVESLGAFPLPIEIIPMARALVMRELERRGGRPILRAAFVSDHGNQILDVHGLSIPDPAAMEADLHSIPGVVTAGIFALRPADIVLAGRVGGVDRIERALTTGQR